MLQNDDSGTEILLGNKQLLLVFFVVAALLGIAFTGGYMLGRGPAPKRTDLAGGTAGPVASAARSSSTSDSGTAGGETHSVAPADEVAGSKQPAVRQPVHTTSGNVLGASKAIEAVTLSKPDSFSPQSGQEFLQIAAVDRKNAGTVAQTLRMRGFHAHAVPKPGDPKLFRVIVGPIHDAGELASTRDSLRKTGFSNVIVQRYE